MAYLATIWDLLSVHGSKIALSVGGVVLGAWWGRRRARRQWERREFFHRLNVSLNTLEGGFLRIRTVLEKDLQEVMLNRVAVARVLEAASRTTEEEPLLPLTETDSWFLLNAVLNEISEHFAPGLLRKDLGLPVDVARYVLCLTNEVAGAVRTRKVRAMMVRANVLDSLPEEMPRLESPSHDTRWHTLRSMAAARTRRPHLLLEVEIAV